jgi:hypothetical protein
MQRQQKPQNSCVARLDWGIEVDPLSLSLSPFEGERVPFRAGEGLMADSPSFHERVCLILVRVQPETNSTDPTLTCAAHTLSNAARI